MKFFVYILFSKKLQTYYVGQTNNITERLLRHNGGRVNYTKKGVPWELKFIFEVNSRSEAMALEEKIKKRGITRYIDDKKLSFVL